jgi:hypothetical protein
VRFQSGAATRERGLAGRETIVGGKTAVARKRKAGMTDEELNRRFDKLHETMRDMEARTLETMRDM